MKKIAFNFLAVLGFAASSFGLPLDSGVAAVSPSNASAALIHQLFKSCKKGKALYTCMLPGKTITAALNKTKSNLVLPMILPETLYNLYWWPKNCTPSGDIKDLSCQFNLLLQASEASASTVKSKLGG